MSNDEIFKMLERIKDGVDDNRIEITLLFDRICKLEKKIDDINSPTLFETNRFR